VCGGGSTGVVGKRRGDEDNALRLAEGRENTGDEVFLFKDKSRKKEN
jgi:hypothetical protein